MSWLARGSLFFLFTAAFGAGTAEAAETLTIAFDWKSDVEAEYMAAKLQDGGLLAFPMIYVNKQAVAMLGDDVDVPDHGNVLVEVGSHNVLEGPLYRFIWPPDANAPNEVLVTSPDLAPLQYDPKYPKKRGLLSQGLELKKAPVSVDQAGRKLIQLDAKPYAALARLTFEDYDAIKSAPGAFVPVYQADKKTGLLNEPLVEYVASSDQPVTTNVIRQKFGAQYAQRVDADWFGEAVEFFKAEPKEAILIKSVPTQSEIFVSGARYRSTTDSRVEVVKRKWSEIFVRRKDYKSCQVDLNKLVPPSKIGDPPAFICKLKKL